MAAVNLRLSMTSPGCHGSAQTHRHKACWDQVIDLLIDASGGEPSLGVVAEAKAKLAIAFKPSARP
jgi:hypothetical protein